MLSKAKLKPYNILVITLILFGSIFRLIKLSQFNNFSGENGIQLLRAERILKLEFPAGGEISRIDKDSKNIIHNSPIGLYFYSIIYLLGLKTPEGYALVYLLINLLSIYLLYKSANIFFSKSAGIFLLFVAMFNKDLIWLNTWVSQSSNAIVFESVAIFFLACYTKNKTHIRYLILSWTFSFLATNLYPPMYLILPLKIFFLIYLLSKIPEKKKTILILIISSLLIVSPLVIQEIKTHANINAISGYFSLNESPVNYVFYFDIDWVKVFLKYVNTLNILTTANIYLTKIIDVPIWTKVAISVFIAGLFLFHKDKHKSLSIGIITTFILFPLFFITSFCRYEYGSFCPTYYHSIFWPYTLLLFSGIFHFLILLKRFRKH